MCHQVSPRHIIGLGQASPLQHPCSPRHRSPTISSCRRSSSEQCDLGADTSSPSKAQTAAPLQQLQSAVPADQADIAVTAHTVSGCDPDRYCASVHSCGVVSETSRSCDRGASYKGPIAASACDPDCYCDAAKQSCEPASSREGRRTQFVLTFLQVIFLVDIHSCTWP